MNVYYTKGRGVMIEFEATHSEVDFAVKVLEAIQEVPGGVARKELRRTVTPIQEQERDDAPMKWILWSILANISITFLENTYRKGVHMDFVSALPYVIVPILLAQWGLFNSYRSAHSLFTAWIVFFSINTLMRVGNNIYLGEPLNVHIVVGLVAIMVGAYLIKMGT